jgi:hypothetical protein
VMIAIVMVPDGDVEKLDGAQCRVSDGRTSDVWKEEKPSRRLGGRRQLRLSVTTCLELS